MGCYRAGTFTLLCSDRRNSSFKEEGGLKLGFELYVFIASSAVLLAIGLYGLMVKRNMVKLVMSLEIMLSAATLNFVNFASHRIVGMIDPLAHVFAIIAISVEACVIGVALTFIINVYRHYKTLDIRKVKRLRW
ncbi:MAG TPA: NADH-quinone oxidoreductase subunit NuoK [Candidatus Bathyarchaeota archaeon]|nr:MAG: NADH-quinone oxidoreductase subunit NuoK [Candidatus Verstraetearchaeota archaeon]HDO21187.1 NADH-quinone oxidoreductase subunit NuoK [Candidatus Bathyarchaeota archaeon]